MCDGVIDKEPAVCRLSFFAICCNCECALPGPLTAVVAFSVAFVFCFNDRHFVVLQKYVITIL